MKTTKKWGKASLLKIISIRVALVLLLTMIISGNVLAQELIENDENAPIGAKSTGSGKWTIGGRLGVDFGMNEMIVTTVAAPAKGEESLVGFGLAAPYVNYAISGKFAVQAELNFMFNQGMKAKNSNSSVATVDLTVAYTSLDIPVLLKYAFINKPVYLGLLAGPYLSFPLGKASIDGSVTANFGGLLSDKETISQDIKIEGARGGIILGAFAGFPIGPGRIVGDFRFLTDFTPVEIISSIKMFDQNIAYAIELTRRSLNLTVGYEISF